jgi:hypothetical protein
MPSIRRIISLLACASVATTLAQCASFQAAPGAAGCQSLALPKVVPAAVNLRSGRRALGQ